MLEEFKKRKLEEFTKQFIHETSGGWTGLGEVTPPSEDLIEFDPAKYLKFIEDLIREVESAMPKRLDGLTCYITQFEERLNNPKK